MKGLCEELGVTEPEMEQTAALGDEGEGEEEE